MDIVDSIIIQDMQLSGKSNVRMWFYLFGVFQMFTFTYQSVVVAEQHGNSWLKDSSIESIEGIGENLDHKVTIDPDFLKPIIFDETTEYRLILSGPTEDRVEPTTCREYLGLKTDGYVPENNAMIAMESYFMYRCGALEWLPKAKPSSRPWGQMVEFTDGNEPVKTLSRTIKLLYTSDGSTIDEIRAAMAEEGTTVYLNPAMWGDFNNDGAEDVLVMKKEFTSGSFRHYSLLILSQ